MSFYSLIDLSRDQSTENPCCHFNNYKTICAFQADVDGNGSIDYIEFITATMHMNRVEREDHLFKAFEYFDKDKSG